jgi:hypothetical protein
LPLEPEGSRKGAVILIRRNNDLLLFDKVYDDIDKLITSYNIYSLPQHDPERCFSEQYLNTESVHLRFRYSNGRQWASEYTMDSIPEEVRGFIKGCRDLTKIVYAEQVGKPITAQEAISQVEEASKEDLGYNPDVIVKIMLKSSGQILMNDKEVALSDLITALDILKAKHGSVWYSREEPGKQPSDDLWKIIKQVLDEIAIRKIPIKLSE